MPVYKVRRPGSRMWWTPQFMNEDALVKLGLGALLGPFVQVHTQYPAQPPAQFVDVFVATDASQPERMRQKDERVTRWVMDFHQAVQQQPQMLKDEG